MQYSSTSKYTDYDFQSHNLLKTLNFSIQLDIPLLNYVRNFRASAHKLPIRPAFKVCYNAIFYTNKYRGLFLYHALLTTKITAKLLANWLLGYVISVRGRKHRLSRERT